MRITAHEGYIELIHDNERFVIGTAFKEYIIEALIWAEHLKKGQVKDVYLGDFERNIV